MVWFTTAVENMFVDKDAQPFDPVPSEIIKVNHESNGRYRAWNFNYPCTLFSSQHTPIHFRAAHNNNSQREAVNAAKEKSPSPLILKNITNDVSKK